MPIPKPEGSETEQDFIGRCMSEISGEYEQEQALGICYSTYRAETKMSTQQKIASKFREIHYKGIDLTKLAEDDGLEGACWEGYEAIGMKELDGRMVPNCVPIKE